MQKEDKNLISLRLSAQVDQCTKTKAESIGVSQNALLNILIDLGLRLYETDVGFIPQQKNQ